MQKTEQHYNHGENSGDLLDKGEIVKCVHEMCKLPIGDTLDFPLVSWRFSDVTRADFHWLKHNNYHQLALELTIHGTMEYWNEGKRLLAPAGTLYVVAPGSNVRMANASNIPRRKIALLIRGTILPGLLAALHFTQDKLLVLHDPEVVEQKMRAIGKLMKKEEMRQQNSVLTYELLLHLAAANPQPDYPEVVERAIELIHTQYNRKISTSQIAEKAGISLSTLDRLFRRYLECSPHNYLLRYRLTKAAGMLANKELAVKVVAENCGFGSPVQFGELFKNFYGVTPGAYRKNIFH